MIFNVNGGKGQDENLLPENIREGVEIDGVVGAMKQGIVFTEFNFTSDTDYVTIQNPYGTNLNGAIIFAIDTTLNSYSNPDMDDMILVESLVKLSNGYWMVSYSCENSNGSFGGGQYRISLDEINEYDEITVSNTTVRFEYFNASVDSCFRGKYLAAVW